MKSKYFKDTQGLESAFEVCTPDKVSICLRISKEAYDYALSQAACYGMTSGEYIEMLLLTQKDHHSIMCSFLPPSQH
ncbi:MAG: hypothetical protein GX096_05825 [Clostridiales bacterium]|nr:hypothetical protein [Clostridiales bacterium]